MNNTFKSVLSCLLAILTLVSAMPLATLASSEEPYYSAEEENIVTDYDAYGDVVAAVSAETLGLTEVQLNSINMLNYLAVLTQEIIDSKNNRLYLEQAYSLLLDNINPETVDRQTQTQVNSILDTLFGLRMVEQKRERLEYIYENNKAQSIDSLLPSPMTVLNVVQSKSYMKSLLSLIYMSVESNTSYIDSMTEAEEKYIQDGWELDDEEAEELHTSRKSMFNYMVNLVNEYDLPGTLTLNDSAVEEYVSWKNNENLAQRIQFFESEQDTYMAFGPYWLTLAQSYYDNGQYEDCLTCVNTYEAIQSDIFRKDYDYAEILPLAIVSAQMTMTDADYSSAAAHYANEIIENTDYGDWSLRYFAAQTYAGLYGVTGNVDDLQTAYNIVLNIANCLVAEQREKNNEYMSEVVEQEMPDDATSAERREVRQLNNMLKEERKTALPPVSDALYVSLKLLFALADELQISDEEKQKVDAILHGEDEALFLNEALDSQYSFSSNAFSASEIDVGFNKGTITLPVTCLSDTAEITVTVTTATGSETVFSDWTIVKVERQDEDDVSTFTATYESKSAAKYKYADGDWITITLYPTTQYEVEPLLFYFRVVPQKVALVFNGTIFERVMG